MPWNFFIFTIKFTKFGVKKISFRKFSIFKTEFFSKIWGVKFKINKDENIEKSKEKNINGVNITHSKINEFRKCYDLKEKDYPDEMLIKALIRYRGNKEMAFQYLFY